MSRNVLRRHPGVSQDGNRGKDRDYDDGDRKEFCHDASPSGCRLRLPLLSWKCSGGERNYAAIVKSVGFRFESKVDVFGLVASNREVGSLGAVIFMPGGDGVLAGRQVR